LTHLNKANEDAAIITKVLELESGGKTYLHAKYDDEKYPIGRSDDYPEISYMIKKFYCDPTEKPAISSMTEVIQKLVLHSDSSDEESELQEGISKLKLFFLCGTMNLVSGEVIEPDNYIYYQGTQRYHGIQAQESHCNCF